MVTIGIASYGNPEKLRATIESIERNTKQEYRLLIWHNMGKEDAACHDVIAQAVSRGVPIGSGKEGPETASYRCGDNVGYAGAVNGLLAECETDYFLYCDNDIEIQTPGWDEKLCAVLDANPEVAQVFPGAGHYGFFNGKYRECLWSAGYCWGFRMSVLDKAIPTGERWNEEIDRFCEDNYLMDAAIGHHEEVDLMIRLRMAGHLIAACPSVQVIHHESSTQSPESAKRIHAGVVRFMNKWNRYFVGDAITYPNPDPDSGETYDKRSLRYTRWPPCALYMERWALSQFPRINAEPEVIQTSVGPMDVIKVLREKGYYHERCI